MLDIVHEEKSFLEHTTVEGFQRNHRGNHVFIVGVDIRCVLNYAAEKWCLCHQYCHSSIWYASCEAVFKDPKLRARAGENPELRILFFKLCRYLRSPVTLVFVFDGPQRPHVKRGKKVVHRAHQLTEEAKELITAFGFYYHQVSSRHYFCYIPTDVLGSKAPGEAEAELAKLNAADMIDAVITDDSDAWAFGGQHVIRR